MSFSGKVKEEICGQYGLGRHCGIAEFAAIFNICGKIQKSHFGKICLLIPTENLTVAKKSDILLKKVFHVQADVAVSSHVRSRGVSYTLYVRNQTAVLLILKAMKVVDEHGNVWGSAVQIHQRLVQNTCCKRAFLRGSFLAAGSITNPEKAYHLEFSVLSKSYAIQLQSLMASFGLEAKMIERKKYQVLYLKEGSQIVDFLNVIEAHMALMELENVRILKEVRNSVNRQVNCETANIHKTVTAAARQVEDIQYIASHMGLHQLTDGLREIAELRLDYPDCSLQELGEMLPVPLSKSGVNHRLRKLGRIAEKLRNYQF